MISRVVGTTGRVTVRVRLRGGERKSLWRGFFCSLKTNHDANTATNHLRPHRHLNASSLATASTSFANPANKWTRHVIVPPGKDSLLLSKLVAGELEVSEEDGKALVEFGSVYVNQNPVVSNSPTVRCMEDINLKEGNYVRIYPNPSRYDNVDSINWQETILYHSDEFVVVNKPAGVPCNPTVSNFHQNVMECIRKAIGVDQVYNPHRLDVATSGILVFGKTKKFAKKFGKRLKNNEIKKTYRLLVANCLQHYSPDIEYSIQFPIEGSILTHYMETSKSYPKVLHLDEVPDSKNCTALIKSTSCPTIVRTREQLMENSSTINDNHILPLALRHWFDYADRKSAGTSAIAFKEVEIELVTGRTHQLRCQVLATGSGNFIAGDEVYVMPAYSELIEQKESGALGNKNNPIDPKLIASPYLALQACKLEIMNEEHLELLDNRSYIIESAFWTPLFSQRDSKS